MARTSVFATVSPEAVAADLAAAAKAGKATFHVRRSDGTFRRMAYLPPGSAARRQAEKVMQQREKKVSMKDIAKAMHVSIPTVRRIINNLELSRHIETGDMNYAVALAEKGTDPQPVDTVPTPRATPERPRTGRQRQRAS